MIAEYERFHGAVLHELIVGVASALFIEALKGHGRISSFLLNGRVGLQIKHCSKRLAPWSFTFTDGTDRDLHRLLKRVNIIWFALICGQDGVLVISYDEYLSLTAESATRSKYVRVDRDRGTMYHVTGNAGQLQSAKPRGVASLVTILEQYTAKRPPSARRKLRQPVDTEYKLL